MKKTDTEQAYKAIKDYVQTHVNGDADDAYCACCNFFDRHKDEYDEAIGKIEDFARATARSCLYVENNASTRRKNREKVYTESHNQHRGETAERGRIQRLVEKALSKLTDSEFAIMVWDLYKSDDYMCSLHRLAEIWGLPWETFRRNKLEPARQKFAEAFGEVVGNPKLYAKLRAEVLAKGKETKNEQDGE